MPAKHPSPPVSSIVVNTRLPEGGLEAVLDMDCTPISNARGWHHLRGQTIEPGKFPMMGLQMAASSPDFLRALGKPLAIARDLESEPGVWVLTTPDDQYQWVIFSDCHRKNAWKGGQICAVYGGSLEHFNIEHPVVDLMRQAVARHWGIPEQEPGLLDWNKFFQAAQAEQPSRVWPRLDKAPVIKPPRVRGPRR